MNERKQFFMAVHRQCEAIPHYPSSLVAEMRSRMHPLERDIVAFLFFLPNKARGKHCTERVEKLAASFELMMTAFHTHSYVKEVDSKREKMYLLSGDFLLTLAYGYLKETTPPSVLCECARISEAISSSWFLWREIEANEQTNESQIKKAIELNYGALYHMVCNLSCEDAGCDEEESALLSTMAGNMALLWGITRHRCPLDTRPYRQALLVAADELALDGEMNWFFSALDGHEDVGVVQQAAGKI